MAWHNGHYSLRHESPKELAAHIPSLFSWLDFHGGDGPSGVGIVVEFPFVILAVVLPAIVLPLAVWLPWIAVCASADIAPKFIDATTPATNIPIATIVTPNLTLLHVVLK